jgi:5'-methylthioadenosine phosphorylase
VEHVSVEYVVQNLHKNAANAKRLLLEVLPALEELMTKVEGKGSTLASIITAENRRDPKQVKALSYLFPALNDKMEKDENQPQSA